VDHDDNDDDDNNNNNNKFRPKFQKPKTITIRPSVIKQFKAMILLPYILLLFFCSTNNERHELYYELVRFWKQKDLSVYSL
jgi:hypothetical protein